MDIIKNIFCGLILFHCCVNIFGMEHSENNNSLKDITKNGLSLYRKCLMQKKIQEDYIFKNFLEEGKDHIKEKVSILWGFIKAYNKLIRYSAATFKEGEKVPGFLGLYCFPFNFIESKQDPAVLFMNLYFAYNKDKDTGQYSLGKSYLKEFVSGKKFIFNIKEETNNISAHIKIAEIAFKRNDKYGAVISALEFDNKDTDNFKNQALLSVLSCVLQSEIVAMKLNLRFVYIQKILADYYDVKDYAEYEDVIYYSDILKEIFL